MVEIFFFYFLFTFLLGPEQSLMRTWIQIRIIMQCCGAGAGGAEIIWDLEPELKLNFL